VTMSFRTPSNHFYYKLVQNNTREREYYLLEYNVAYPTESQPTCHLLSHCVTCSAYSDPEDASDVSPKRQSNFNGLHGVISQKTEVFITRAVRTLNPTYVKSGESDSSAANQKFPYLL
jgi:hypothetical protein